MNRFGSLLSCALWLAAGCTNDAGPAKASPTSPAAAAEAHALLDDYVAQLRALGQAGDPEPFVTALAEHEQRAQALARAGKLDATVRDRHARLVEVSRAIVAPAADDATRLEHADTLSAFVRDVGGPDAASVDPNGGLSSFVPLILEEVLQLHMHIDGETDREKTRARYLAGLET